MKMSVMERLTLTPKEQGRIQVLNGVNTGEVTVEVAAELMRVSMRHAWRLLAAYREEGAAALAHGNRGRKPSTTTDTDTQQHVREMAQGPTHFSWTTTALRSRRGWGHAPADSAGTMTESALGATSMTVGVEATRSPSAQMDRGAADSISMRRACRMETLG